MIPLYYLLYIIRSYNSENLLWVVNTSDELEKILEYTNINSKYEKYYIIERAIKLEDKEKELKIEDFKSLILNKDDVIIKASI
tara:strand:+ start:2305 stop:2553 length:249 start_codon:yes stop_codon:yes gene_type:complete